MESLRSPGLPACPGCRLALISVHASPLAAQNSIDDNSQGAHLAHLARELARSGVAVDIFTRRCAPQQPEIVQWQDGVRVIHVPAGPPQPLSHETLQSSMLEFARWLARFASRRPAPYDLAHATCFTSGMIALHLKHVLGLPFALSFHTLVQAPGHVPARVGAGAEERFRIEATLMREAGCIVATCPQARREIAQLYGAAPARIAVVPRGYAPGEFWPVPRPEARRRLDIDPAHFVVLQLGHIAPRNGIDTVLQGLAMLRQNHGVDARLLVVGGDQRGPLSAPSDAIGRRRRDGAELARLRQLARELGVMQHVRFAGRQPRHALRDYYSAADVFASTPWYAPCGITPVEAMACARPVVASRVGAIESTVVDGVTAYLVPARDPEALAERLAQLQRQPALARAMGEAGRARACEQFTWQRVATHMLALYREVADTAPAREPDRPVPTMHASSARVAGTAFGQGMNPSTLS